jgi:hypothetical protein
MLDNYGYITHDRANDTDMDVRISTCLGSQDKEKVPDRGIPTHGQGRPRRQQTLSGIHFEC